MSEPLLLHVVRSLRPGGIESLLLDVLPRLRARGRACELLCIGREPGPLAQRFREAGVPVHHRHVASRWSPRGLWSLRREIRRRRPALVHTHGYAPNVTGTVGAWSAGVPAIVAHVHGFLDWSRSPRRCRTEARMTGLRVAVLAVSVPVRDRLLEIGVPADKAVLLENGVDVERFGSLSRMESGDPRGRLGIVAALRPEKGHLVVLDALALLRERGLRPNLRIAGEGETRKAVAERIDRLGLGDQVRMLGFTEEPERVLAELDVALVPSLSEGFGMAVLEAQAAGVPVVASSTGGIPELVHDGASGLLVPPGDAAALASAIERLLDDEGLRGRLAAEGRRAAEAHSLDRYVERLDDLYEGWVGRG